jgi:threonylcarbamoyladenosine tRNA methylthiotransferase MtaB
MKISVLTLGCKVNQSESYSLESNLINRGCSLVPLHEEPYYSVINTCTVTSKSDYQSRQLIRRSLRSGAKVIVTGCYAQTRPHEIRNIDDTIRIVNNKNKSNIIKLITNNESCNTSHYHKRSRAYLKVQDGCNFSCSYCVVPQARGKSHSLKLSEVIHKAREFEKADYKEIVLTGIHLGLYGHDLRPKMKLSELLKILLNKTKIPRFRLSSLEINEITEDIIELLQDRRICSHLHIPLQSGDDYVLKRMNRNYNVNKIASKIEKIVKKVTDISIGTDVIVGFPGEGDEEFLNTKNIIKSLPFSYIHIFPFSKRPNTIASSMKEQNTKNIKHERYTQLNALNIKKKAEYMSGYINKTLDIIIEEKGEGDTLVGTSGNYLKVSIPSLKYNKGTLIRVRVVRINDNRLIAYPLLTL